VRFVLQLVKSVRQAIEALATTPSALHVAIPVYSSAERAMRLPPSRARRFH